jgi:tocopherol cyclase
MKVFKPEVFQGNLKKKNYFEGWYFKHVSGDRENVYSFIPGISLTDNDQHAFIQFIDGISGETAYIRYPVSSFRYSRNKLEIGVENSGFSKNGVALNIDAPDLKVKGTIAYKNLVEYPSTILSPGIMGWYSFVPFMECKHGIASVLHQLSGSLEMNGKSVSFSEGTGYIEKDWGTSFPESWIWLHCNTFDEPDCSFTFSVAKIPWLGSFFIGHICFLYFKGKFYRFATYNNSKITALNYSDGKLVTELKSKKYTLNVKAVQKSSGPLKAPATGRMDRIIKESIDSEIELTLLDANGNIIISTHGNHAGMELIHSILSYF